jgi:ribosomal protein S6--L-glutamate ligase/gamma-F420-2:alpha-L-glutamate ligase
MSVLTNTYELNTMYQQLSFPCLVKERFYQKGTKPYFIQDVETLKGVLKQLEMKPLMVQLYVPYEGRREFQVFVVGNRVITAMELIIKDQESKFIEVEVPLIVKNISIKAMSSIGADFAVVHVLFDLQQIPYVYALETQPDILNIQSVTGVSVCGYIARHVVKTLKSKD